MSIGWGISFIMPILIAIVKRPKMITILVWALEPIFFPIINPNEEPTATVIVLTKVPINTMHTSYICVIIIERITGEF